MIYLLIPLIIVIALIVLFTVSSNKAYKPNKKQQEKEDAETERRLKEIEEKQQIITFPVVGVVYDNKNGRNRQEIIKEITRDLCGDFGGYTKEDAEEYGDLFAWQYEGNQIPLKLLEFTYENAPAFYVAHKAGIIGTVPKEKVKPIIDTLKEFPNIEIYGEITGGKYKRFTENEIIDGERENFGVDVTAIFTK